MRILSWLRILAFFSVFSAIFGFLELLVNKELSGDEWEEKQEMVKKLEDVTSYLKDALGQGIEF